jgi:ketosteroid isomerase-like protein
MFVLGELGLEADGPLDRIGSRRARSLLGWLTVHPGLHPRARVAAVLWPNVLDASARPSLRTTLATLRRELDEQDAGGLMTATQERLGVQPGPEVWIDLRCPRETPRTVRPSARDTERAMSQENVTEAERIIDLADDRVLVLSRQTARGKVSGAPIDHELGFVFTLHDGRIIGCDLYWDRADALEAAGLQE